MDVICTYMWPGFVEWAGSCFIRLSSYWSMMTARHVAGLHMQIYLKPTDRWNIVEACWRWVNSVLSTHWVVGKWLAVGLKDLHMQIYWKWTTIWSRRVRSTIGDKRNRDECAALIPNLIMQPFVNSSLPMSRDNSQRRLARSVNNRSNPCPARGMPPPPLPWVFSRIAKNGGVQRWQIWHSLWCIPYTYSPKILGQCD